MKNNFNQLALEIITKNQYCALSTTDSDSNPWVSPIAYAHNDEGIFYFVSIPDSKHIQNIKANNRVSFTIFDSHQDWGMGIGLQIEGTAEEVKLTELPRAMLTYFSRKYPYGSITNSFADGLKNLLHKKTYNLYRITPTKYWINNPESDVDERVEVRPFDK